jgi:hypothetical protein
MAVGLLYNASTRYYGLPKTVPASGGALKADTTGVGADSTTVTADRTTMP